jgi:hypothetical protein
MGAWLAWPLTAVWQMNKECAQMRRAFIGSPPPCSPVGIGHWATFLSVETAKHFTLLMCRDAGIRDPHKDIEVLKVQASPDLSPPVVFFL